MFRNRRRQDTLPTSSNAAPSVFHMPKNGNNGGNFFGGGSVPDGSGKAIHMEAPVARAWKKATMYTKGTYYATLGCLFLAYFGYRWLRWSHASIHLICHTQECTFSITPKGWKGSHTITFPRHQLVKAESMKVDEAGEYVSISPRLDDFDDIPQKGKNKNRKKSTSYKGPDKRGHYPSYRLTLREFEEMPDHHGNVKDREDIGDEKEDGEMDSVRLTMLEDWMERGPEFTLNLIIRKHGIFQSRRRVKTTVQKIDSYIKRRRHKLTVKENTPPSWQGILMLVLGIFGLLLTMLIGQYWEPEEPKRTRGPGTRRSVGQLDPNKGTRPVALRQRKGY